jgi:hypothetical protein
MTSSFSVIPIVLYKEIELFLDRFTFYNLLNTSKEIFQDINAEIRNIFLDEVESVFYVENPEWQQLLLGKIKDPSHQLSFWLNYSCSHLQVEQLKSLSYNRLRIDNAKELQNIPSWITVLNNGRDIQLEHNRSISSFEGLQECVKKLCLTCFSALIDVRALSSLQELTFFSCGSVSDVACLKNVRDLSFRDCSNLRDISSLGNVYCLELKKCPNITDISALVNNSFLMITECRNIVDVSILRHSLHLRTDLLRKENSNGHFSRIQSLELSACNYTEIPVSITLQSIKFTSCSIFLIENFQFLQHLEKVFFSSCSELTSLEGLDNVGSIRIFNCNKLASLNGISNRQRRIKSFYLETCHGIKQFSNLATVPSVEIHNCVHFHDAAELASVSHLVLSGCKEVINMNQMSNLIDFKLVHCPLLLHFSSALNSSNELMKCLKELHLIHCLQLLSNNERFFVELLAFQQLNKMVLVFHESTLLKSGLMAMWKENHQPLASKNPGEENDWEYYYNSLNYHEMNKPFVAQFEMIEFRTERAKYITPSSHLTFLRRRNN